MTEIPPDAKIKRDESGAVRRIDHPFQSFTPSDAAALATRRGGDAVSARELADAYLGEVLPLLELPTGATERLARSAGLTEPDSPTELRFAEEKDLPNRAEVAYVQTFMNLPVWQAGVAVKLAGPPYRVVGAQSTVHRDLEVEVPPPDARFRPEAVDEEGLSNLLALPESPRINGTRSLIYQFDPLDAGNGFAGPGTEEDRAGHVPGPTLDVVLADLEAGRHYVVTEVLFTVSVRGWDDVNWRVFLHPATGEPLRLESFVGCVNGLVFLRDPITRSGSTSVTAASAAASLDALRDEVELAGLDSPGSGQQELRGDFVQVRNVSSPNVLPPTRPQGDDFEFSVPTDDFAATNAYYHCDRLFRMLAEMGFDVASYFDGTQFPVPVDHRVSYDDGSGFPTPNIVNASAPGNITGSGSDGFRFALVQRDTAVGMAVEWRVILHEFGHAILWDHLRSPNFRFAHSPGDSLAAILNDPGTLAPDRGRTFPWTIITRRHDRRPEDGWAWGGSIDTPVPVGFPSSDRAGYRREQILSSTLFRYYLAIGGEHTDVAVQEAAARYACFLIFLTVGGLTSFAPPLDAEDLADEMIGAEAGIAVFEGWAGATTHKVLRWAFEQQGAFQAPGTVGPVDGPGLAPDVDVFIDDGRGGAYTATDSYRFGSDQIWNRLADDDGTFHQPPRAGQPNFLYVRVGNRGQSSAQSARVRVFTTSSDSDRIWPQDWQPFETPEVQAASVVGSGGDEVVGPFSWQPPDVGPVTVMAVVSDDEDAANVDFVSAPVAAALLAHCDNNIAGRTLEVVDGDDPDDPDGPDDGDPHTVVASVQPRLAIPDADPAGVTSTLFVQESGTIVRIVVSLAIVHTFRGDLRVSLISPEGTEVLLFEGMGESTDDVIGTASSDSSALSQLVGEEVHGSFRLRVVDRVGLDVGTLERWSLEVDLE